MDITLLVDKILPFLRKKQSLILLEQLSLFQFYTQRFGIGERITNDILSSLGVHKSVKIKKFPLNVVNKDVKNVLEQSNEFLDVLLEKLMVKRLLLDIELYNYRGDRYKLRLPLHGQRRRANGKTTKKIRPL